MGLPIWRVPPPIETKSSGKHDATAAARSPIRRRNPSPPYSPTAPHNGGMFTNGQSSRIVRLQIPRPAPREVPFTRTNVFMTTQEINAVSIRLSEQYAAEAAHSTSSTCVHSSATRAELTRRSSRGSRARVRRENARVPAREYTRRFFDERDDPELPGSMPSNMRRPRLPSPLPEMRVTSQSYSTQNHGSARRAVASAVNDDDGDQSDFPALRRTGHLSVAGGPIYSTALNRSPSNMSASSLAAPDGLGDRERSISSEGDHWETMLTTIAPDVHLPTPDSSFTSAAASASFGAGSRRSAYSSNAPSASSSSTQLTVPSPLNHSSSHLPGCDSEDSGSDTEPEGFLDDDQDERNDRLSNITINNARGTLDPAEMSDTAPPAQTSAELGSRRVSPRPATFRSFTGSRVPRTSNSSNGAATAPSDRFRPGTSSQLRWELTTQVEPSLATESVNITRNGRSSTLRLGRNLLASPSPRRSPSSIPHPPNAIPAETRRQARRPAAAVDELVEMEIDVGEPTFIPATSASRAITIDNLHDPPSPLFPWTPAPAPAADAAAIASPMSAIEAAAQAALSGINADGVVADDVEELELFRPILERLAARQDIPEEFWISAGLTHTMTRSSGTGGGRETR